MQHVRAAIVGERRALLDAEAVLLVDDRHREVAKLDVPLDQRVCSDGDLDIARRDELPHDSMLPRSERAGQQCDAHPQLRAEPLDREKVLLGEGFGRRHQRGLPTVLDRSEKRVERDRRLARADVTLEQAPHRRGRLEVGVDLGDRVLLRRGQDERERGAVTADELAGWRERLGDELLPLRGPSTKCKLHRDQLVEGEPRSRALGLFGRARMMERHECVRPERQLLAHTHRARKRVSSGAGEHERAVRNRAKLLLGEIGGRRVHRREVGGLRRVSEVVRLHLEAESIPLAADAELRAGRQPRLEPRLVEPRRPDLSGPVRDVSRDEMKPPTRTPARGAADDDVERRLLVAEQLRDRPIRGRALVSARRVREHVPHGDEAEPGELLANGGADAVEGLDACLEHRRVRPAARPR